MSWETVALVTWRWASIGIIAVLILRNRFLNKENSRLMGVIVKLSAGRDKK